MSSAARRLERRATRRLHRAVPRPATRSLLAIGARALDAVGLGAEPLCAVVVEHGPHAIARVEPVTVALAALPAATADIVRRLERARHLTAADGFVLAIPELGRPEGMLVGRPGRYLADEDLGELVQLAMKADVSIAAGGEA